MKWSSGPHQQHSKKGCACEPMELKRPTAVKKWVEPVRDMRLVEPYSLPSIQHRREGTARTASPLFTKASLWTLGSRCPLPWPSAFYHLLILYNFVHWGCIQPTPSAPAWCLHDTCMAPALTALCEWSEVASLPLSILPTPSYFLLFAAKKKRQSDYRVLTGGQSKSQPLFLKFWRLHS